MKKELNIVAILKDKPQNTRLWSPTVGECNLIAVVDDKYYKYPIKTRSEENINVDFMKNGNFAKNGEICLFPSKQMQDWLKFAWKKGDVLICGFDNLCIFDKWCNEEYTEFEAKFVSPDYGGAVLKTHNCCKALNESTIKQHISKIEEVKGGKLNLETLEIEKPKQEFKDGDILHKDGDILHNDETIYSDETIFIAKISDGIIGTYAYLDKLDERITMRCDSFEEFEIDAIRLATDSEKQQLFDALAKENKRWNPDTKQIEDLIKKCEFKAFDKVLARNCDAEIWIPTLFGFYDEEFRNYVCMSEVFDECIPYNEETAHLLGTTDEWKGGK